MFIIILGQHISILTESSSAHSKKIDPYLKCLKMYKIYKMHAFYIFYTQFYQECKRLGSHSAFLNIFSKDLFS